MTPVKTDSRISFGIEFYATEAEAERRGQQVRTQGDTYNGGWLHGKVCGRDPSFDYLDPEHGRLYAVTTR